MHKMQHTSAAQQQPGEKPVSDAKQTKGTDKRPDTDSEAQAPIQPI